MLAGPTECTTVPMAPPSMAPIKRDGAKMPTDPPEPMVIENYIILKTTRSKMK